MTKYQIFQKLPQISHIHKKSYWKLKEQLLLPYEVSGSDVREEYKHFFFHFVSCESLNQTNQLTVLLVSTCFDLSHMYSRS